MHTTVIKQCNFKFDISSQEKNAPREIAERLGGLISIGYALKNAKFCWYSLH